jgi:integrase
MGLSSTLRTLFREVAKTFLRGGGASGRWDIMPAVAKKGKKLRGPWGEVWIEYLPAMDRFRLRYSTKRPDGTSFRKAFTAKTPKGVAEKFEAWWRRYVDRGVHTAELLFGEYLDRWLRDVVVPSKAKSTAVEYESVIRNHLKPALGAVRLDELSVMHLQDLVSTKIREGYSPGGVKRIYAVASSALKQAVRWRMILSTPAEGVILPRVHQESGRGAFTRDQVRRLFGVAKAWRGGTLHPILVVAVSTGLRQGEILGLFWDDVDLERGVLAVRRTLSREGRGSTVSYGPPKGGRERSQELSQAMVGLLREHRKSEAARRLEATSWADPRHVFTTAEGKPIHRAVLLQSFKRLCRREGLPEITFHELRHTCATLMAERNIHPNTVQLVMGHRDIKTTLGTYTHHWPSQGRDAAESLSDLLL